MANFFKIARLLPAPFLMHVDPLVDNPLTQAYLIALTATLLIEYLSNKESPNE